MALNEGFSLSSAYNQIDETTKSYELDPKDIHQVELGDAKQSDCFYPQAKIMQWGNETNFSIRFDENPTNNTCEIIRNGDGVKWESSDKKKEVNIYQFDDSEGGVLNLK